MSEPFLTEIRMMSFNFAPMGWAQCNGQLMPINQNQAMFALLGTTYGGNGQTNFALPNLRGRVPVHVGAGLTLGGSGGTDQVTLTQQQMPQHTHFVQASTEPGNQVSPSGNVLASPLNQTYRNPGGPLVALDPSSSTSAGGSQPHENRQPFLTINFCIALQGIFPSQN